MKRLPELTKDKREIENKYFDLIHEVRFLTENIYCLTILGDNTHPEYGYMTITEQTEKLNELTSQLIPLAKENLKVNQAILHELIKETHEPAISEFLKTLLNLSDRTLELNDVIDILLSINLHKLNAGQKFKRSLNLFFSHYNEKYSEQEHSLNVTVTDNIITKINFK